MLNLLFPFHCVRMALITAMCIISFLGVPFLFSMTILDFKQEQLTELLQVNFFMIEDKHSKCLSPYFIKKTDSISI